jgi:hypothetical protein
VAQSSAEVECRAMAAEYRAMIHTASDLTWLHHFLYEIAFSAPTPIPLFCDNQVTLHIVSNPIFHKMTNILMLIVILFEIRYLVEVYLHHLCSLETS